MALPLPANQAMLDRYTLGHLAFGLMLGLAEVRWWVALGASIFFEHVLENPLKATLPGYFPVPTRDAWRNSIADTGAVMLGWWAMRRLPPPTQLVPAPTRA